jgi:hypothetical protein
VRIPRSIAIRAALGTAAALTLGLAFSGAWLLPHKADTLRAEADRLGVGLSRSGPLRAAAADTVPLPSGASLPAGAAAVVDTVRRHGVATVQYRLGQRAPRGTLSAQPLTLYFEAGFQDVGGVLADLAAAAPAVTVTGVDLERADGGRIEVALRLDLLGGA